jgi:hypothetical protein
MFTFLLVIVFMKTVIGSVRLYRLSFQLVTFGHTWSLLQIRFIPVARSDRQDFKNY